MLTASDEMRLPRWMRGKAPAMKEGCLAFLDGRSQGDNPYSPRQQTSRFRDWDNGWTSAEKWVPAASRKN